MPDPPPIGSLWEHKDGERRFHLDSWESPLFGVMRVQYVVVRDRKWTIETVTIADWHAWERNAVRIDKEQS